MPRAATKETMTTTPMTSMKMRRCAVYAPSKTLSTTTATKENDDDDTDDVDEDASVRGVRAE